uniref:hypothetical protein n=1 Tax=Geomesophilobacter sediminis TaxID=2798584 RepID=UPI0022A66153|nr:hypothetical protein [Geomesophilobacter sediminis]
MVCDLDRGTVEHIGDGRDKRSFESYLECLTDNNLRRSRHRDGYARSLRLGRPSQGSRCRAKDRLRPVPHHGTHGWCG